ncbi:Ger(x)C family spore germination protein [Paenibacillus silvisoli]|uniref:Ger(x)C family spore germination protein n=1 Tax=Paenibacillus silvisoli TaxID=3110539 RepID=UPI002805275D|nr:Ger(x)C family spore germination protein [Paenibacillus silvisoli]
MKLIIKALLLIFFLPWLTGCWDRRELKEIRIEQAEGFDLQENGKIRFTITIPSIKSATRSKSTIVVPSIGAEGRTINEAYLDIKKSVSQELDFGKARVILINKRFAKKGLYPALESYYRESHSPINVKMAIVDDSAGKLLEMKAEDRLMISDYLYDLLQSGEENGLIPKASPYLITALLMGRGIDVTLPIVNPAGANRAKLTGVALFHMKQMTGELDSDHAMLLVMLSKFNSMQFTVTEHVAALKTDISLFFNRENRKVTVTTGQDSIKAVVNVHVTGNLVEIPFLTKVDEETLQKISSELERKLNERAKEVIKELQQANCDALGIGVHVKAHHNRFWKSVKWEKVYPEITIEPRIKVDIVKKGVLE